MDAPTWYRDADVDGYGTTTLTTRACTMPSGYVAASTDCNDSVATINPAASERCDLADNDCDGAVDESSAVDAGLWYRDSDGDGFGLSSASTRACTAPTGYVSTSTDCNDAAATISPAGTEVCDAVDNDCDLPIDDGVTATRLLYTSNTAYQPSRSLTASFRCLLNNCLYVYQYPASVSDGSNVSNSTL